MKIDLETEIVTSMSNLIGPHIFPAYFSFSKKYDDKYFMPSSNDPEFKQSLDFKLSFFVRYLVQNQGKIIDKYNFDLFNQSKNALMVQEKNYGALINYKVSTILNK